MWHRWSNWRWLISCPTIEKIPNDLKNDPDNIDRRLSDSELAEQLNLRIEAEKITEDCSTLEPKPAATEDGDPDYSELGFFECKLGMHDSERQSRQYKLHY